MTRQECLSLRLTFVTISVELGLGSLSRGGHASPPSNYFVAVFGKNGHESIEKDSTL